MKNIVRQAKEDDFEQIHNLLLQLHNIHVKARPDIYIDVGPIDKKIYEMDLKDINKINLVAEENNKIVGVCFAEIKKTITNNVMRDRTIINIRDLCVDAKERKKGIGKLLYDEIIKIAGRLKVDSVELMVWGVNEEAIRFFERKFSHQQVSEEDCLKIKIRQGETLFTILADANVTESRAQLRRLFAANAIKTSDKKQTFTMESMPVPGIIRIGKKLFVKLEE